MWYVVIDTFTCSTGDVIEKGTTLEKITKMMNYICFQVKPSGNNIYLSQYEIDNHLEEYEAYYNI